MGFPVFISWSGQQSLEFATLLGEWIPDVLQAAEPFVSTNDIAAGSRWPNVLSETLQNSGFGILCLTSENLEAPWILFEAGAISKMFGSAALVPLLIGVKRSEVKFPLAQFQSVSTDRSDLLKLFKSVKEKGEISVAEDRLIRLFDVTYGLKAKRIGEIESTSFSPVASQRETNVPDLQNAMDQILENIQSLHVILSAPENLLPRSYIEAILESAQAAKRLDKDPISSETDWVVLSKLMTKIADILGNKAAVGLDDDAFNEVFVNFEEAHRRFVILREAVWGRSPPQVRRLVSGMNIGKGVSLNIKR